MGRVKNNSVIQHCHTPTELKTCREWMGQASRKKCSLMKYDGITFTLLLSMMELRYWHSCFAYAVYADHLNSTVIELNWMLLWGFGEAKSLNEAYIFVIFCVICSVFWFKVFLFELDCQQTNLHAKKYASFISIFVSLMYSTYRINMLAI